MISSNVHFEILSVVTISCRDASFIVDTNLQTHVIKEVVLMSYRFLYLSSFLTVFLVILTLSNSSHAYSQADVNALVISINAAKTSTAATPPAKQCRNCDFSGYDFSVASRVCTTPTGGSEVCADLTDLTGVNLTGADLSTLSTDLTPEDNTDDPDEVKTNLNNVDLSGANLSGADLSGANLSKTDLTGADLSTLVITSDDGTESTTKTNLTDAQLAGANLVGANLTGANLTGAQLGDANLVGANLTGAQLVRARFFASNLANAILTNANLNGVEIFISVMEGANLTNANLIDGIIIFTDMAGANLSRADLNRANMNDVNLSLATLDNTDLSGVTMRKGSMRVSKPLGEIISGSTKLSSLFRSSDFSRVPRVQDKKVDLTTATFSPSTDLSNVDLSGVDLSGVNLSDVDFSGANLSGANLSGANLTRTDFSGANLSGANLTLASLDGANFDDANLSNASLSNVTLLFRSTDEPLAPINSETRPLPPPPSFRRANLSGAILTAGNFTDANLNYANLSGAKVTRDTIFSNSRMAYANISNFWTTDYEGTANLANVAILKGAYKGQCICIDQRCETCR